MTDKELDELDRLVAEKIMGWHEVADYAQRYWSDDELQEQGKYKHILIDWMPTRDIAQAWEVLEKFKYYFIGRAPDESFHTAYVSDSRQEPTGEVKAETAPLAIVKACLYANGTEV